MVKKICFSCFIGVVAVAIIFLYILWPTKAVINNSPDFSRGKMTIENASGQKHTFNIEIANTPQQQQYGLMFRKYMSSDEGMLFVSESENVANFWMKNTYIPLDMIFIKADGTITKIIYNTIPNDLSTQSSDIPVKYVLEINSGETEKLGIKVGNKALYFSSPLAGEDRKP